MAGRTGKVCVLAAIEGNPMSPPWHCCTPSSPTNRTAFILEHLQFGVGHGRRMHRATGVVPAASPLVFC